MHLLCYKLITRLINHFPQFICVSIPPSIQLSIAPSIDPFTPSSSFTHPSSISHCSILHLSLPLAICPLHLTMLILRKSPVISLIAKSISHLMGSSYHTGSHSNIGSSWPFLLFTVFLLDFLSVCSPALSSLPWAIHCTHFAGSSFNWYLKGGVPQNSLSTSVIPHEEADVTSPRACKMCISGLTLATQKFDFC